MPRVGLTLLFGWWESGGKRKKTNYGPWNLEIENNDECYILIVQIAKIFTF